MLAPSFFKPRWLVPPGYSIFDRLLSSMPIDGGHSSICNPFKGSFRHWGFRGGMRLLSKLNGDLYATLDEVITGEPGTRNPIVENCLSKQGIAICFSLVKRMPYNQATNLCIYIFETDSFWVRNTVFQEKIIHTSIRILWDDMFLKVLESLVGTKAVFMKEVPEILHVSVCPIKAETLAGKEASMDHIAQ
jgi:hypothetical protein